MRFITRAASFVTLAFTLAVSPAWAAGASMRAIVAKDGRLTVQALPLPQPGRGQVRIKVRAASVNPIDWKLASWATAGTAQVPGRDVAGIIDAVGDPSGRWKPGDAVLGIATSGSYAEYALASAASVAAKPAQVSFEEAAGIPLVAETAWQAIVEAGGVKPGQRVLVHGGAGGVGSAAVQIAKAKGAYVIATASARNQEFLRSLGADETIDYTAVRFEDKAKDIDVVLNTADEDTGLRSVKIVKPDGALVSVVEYVPAAKCRAARIRCPRIRGAEGTTLAPIVDLVSAGKLRINVEERLPLAEAAKAWEKSRAGHVRGKIVLVVSADAS
jgi:NADPH:quinone reductase-like Zn-dependent oxidoreductase